MSRLRKEKNCLNCGHVVDEIYCPNCGQKNVETHVNAFHAIAEFIADYFHADGKFFKSLKPLFLRPGLMTNEYNAGHRERYIHPFRLYIFVSIVYFGLTLATNDGDREEPISANARISLGNSGVVTLQRTDTTAVQDDSTINVLTERASKLPATTKAYEDSVKKLPASERPDFADDVVNRLSIKYRTAGDPGVLIGGTFQKFKNALPKMMFFLLPLAALLLKLLYLRSKKYYIDHLVHTLHLHSFIFLILTIYLLLNLATGWTTIFFALILFMIWYFFASMKRVYAQSRLMTFLKGVLFSILYLASLICIFAAGFFYFFVYA